MSLSDAYERLRPSIVAFTSKFVPVYDEKGELPPFPTIIGTGFVVSGDGLIATNAHVVKAFSSIQRPKDFPADEWPVRATLFHMTDAGQIEIPLEILGVASITGFGAGPAYYGPKEGPDLAFVHVKARDLPAAEIDTKFLLREGDEIATAGFPMGTDALTAPGWLHQLTPTLQKGVVSAVLPYPCEAPHGFSINIMTQGGASGSPVFSCQSGRVLGVLYAGLNDHDVTLKNHDIYKVPTSISYVVPARYIGGVLNQIRSKIDMSAAEGAQSIEEMLEGAQLVNALENDRGWQVWGQENRKKDGK